MDKSNKQTVTITRPKTTEELILSELKLINIRLTFFTLILILWIIGTVINFVLSF